MLDSQVLVTLFQEVDLLLRVGIPHGGILDYQNSEVASNMQTAGYMPFLGVVRLTKMRVLNVFSQLLLCHHPIWDKKD